LKVGINRDNDLTFCLTATLKPLRDNVVILCETGEDAIQGSSLPVVHGVRHGRQLYTPHEATSW